MGMKARKRKKTRVVRGYVCGIAWQHELGERDVVVYETAYRCGKIEKCTQHCGIVEVEIRLKRWVRPQKF